MEVSVYYRSAMRKLRQVDAIVGDTDDVEVVRSQAAEWIKKDDQFAKGPFLALIEGGKK